MANTATAQTALNVRIGGADTVTPVLVTMDTTSSDLTVYTPVNSRNMAAIVGLVYLEASALNLTIKSGSTTQVTLEATTFQGVMKSLEDSAMVIGQPGEAIKFNAATAAPSSMLVYIAEAPVFNFSKR